MRRSFLVVALVMSLTGCAWAQYRGDAGKSGYQAFEGTIGVSNVSRLRAAWSGPADNNGAVVSAGIVFDPTTSGLLALDAAGVKGCGGNPKICGPLWTGLTDGSQLQVPAVINGIVWVQEDTSTLLAFDAAGIQGCGGTPKTCMPLWSASAPVFLSPPAVADGFLYISAQTSPVLFSPAHLLAFDAAGVNGCSGVPKTCLPVWTGTDPSAYYNAGAPAVRNGTVYVGTDDFRGGHHRLAAFDATGGSGCSGTPKTCAPLWTAAAPSSYPTVVGNVVYASGNAGTSTTGELDAYDAAGVQGCSGAPKICTPIWTASTPAGLGQTAVDGNSVYVTSTDGALYAFDATGVTSCSGTPKTCVPKWSANLQVPGFGSLIVANGVVYASTRLRVLAFDAAGVGCGVSNAVCQPLWTSPELGVSGLDLAVVNGNLFVNGPAGITAFNIPPP